MLPVFLHFQKWTKELAVVLTVEKGNRNYTAPWSFYLKMKDSEIEKMNLFDWCSRLIIWSLQKLCTSVHLKKTQSSFCLNYCSYTFEFFVNSWT